MSWRCRQILMQECGNGPTTCFLNKSHGTKNTLRHTHTHTHKCENNFFPIHVSFFLIFKIKHMSKYWDDIYFRTWPLLGILKEVLLILFCFWTSHPKYLEMMTSMFENNTFPQWLLFIGALLTCANHQFKLRNVCNILC